MIRRGHRTGFCISLPSNWRCRFHEFSSISIYVSNRAVSRVMADAIITQIPTRHYITIEKKQIMSTSNIISIAISSKNVIDKESGCGWCRSLRRLKVWVRQVPYFGHQSHAHDLICMTSGLNSDHDERLRSPVQPRSHFSFFHSTTSLL